MDDSRRISGGIHSHNSVGVFAKGHKRDESVDQLRGVAILIMVLANMSPLYVGDVSFLYRFISSLAAPLFVILAGMMVARGYIFKKGSLKKTLHKALFLFLCGACVDMFFFEMLPFVTMEVLYLIGVMLPITYLYCSLSLRTQISVIAIILAVTFFMRPFFAYSGAEYSLRLENWEDLYEFSLSDLSSLPETFQAWLGMWFSLSSLREIGLNWLFNGSFPLFPWSTMALYGAILGRLRWDNATAAHSTRLDGIIGHRSPDFYSLWLERFPLAIPAVLVLVGSLLWFYFPEEQAIREADIELFYPMSLGESLFSFGVAHFGLSFLDYLGKTKRVMPLCALLGKHSLFAYLLHLSIIYPLCAELLDLELNVGGFLFAYIALVTIVYLNCLALEAWQSRRRTLGIAASGS